jgi:hydroxypyruvate isomerase
MGGEFSKEYRRLDEVEKRLAEAKAMVESLHAAAASDAARAAPAAAGMPAAPGSSKARLDAARQYYQQLYDEKIAIYARLGAHGPVQPALRGQLSQRGCLFGVAAWAAFLKCLPACLCFLALIWAAPCGLCGL